MEYSLDKMSFHAVIPKSLDLSLVILELFYLLMLKDFNLASTGKSGFCLWMAAHWSQHQVWRPWQWRAKSCKDYG
jgi:hypothetical protein